MSEYAIIRLVKYAESNFSFWCNAEVDTSDNKEMAINDFQAWCQKNPGKEGKLVTTDKEIVIAEQFGDAIVI